MDKISVIVPVFNVKKYLNQCVDSILNQDYENIEILLIDDGSTDGSSEICNKYANQDSRVKVFHKKNGGLSSARNYGIAKSCGKYISFIDGDDWISNFFISSLYSNIVNFDVDVSCCGIIRYYNNGTTQKYNRQNIKKRYSNIEAQKYLNILGYFNASVCNKLFKRELFDSIKFPVGKKSEDMYIIYKLLSKANYIYYDSFEMYFYRQRSGSITNSGSVCLDSLLAVEEEIEFYKSNKKYKKVLPYAMQLYILTGTGIYNTYLFHKNDIVSANDIRKRIWNVGEKFTLNELEFSRKIQIILFKYFIFFYNLCIKKYLFKKSNKL